MGAVGPLSGVSLVDELLEDAAGAGVSLLSDLSAPGENEQADRLSKAAQAARAREGRAGVTRQPLLRLLRLQLKPERLLQRPPRRARLPWVRRWPRQNVRSKMLLSPTQKTIPSAQLPLLQRMFASRSHLRRSRPQLTRAQLVSLPLSPRASRPRRLPRTRLLRVLVCSLAAWARCSLTSRTSLTRQASNKPQIIA